MQQHITSKLHTRQLRKPTTVETNAVAEGQESHFRIASVAYAPDGLYDQVPCTAMLLREIRGPDRREYWLAELTAPLTLGAASEIRYLVLASRYHGMAITPGSGRRLVGMAFVTDPSLLDDDELDFAKCACQAIGIIDAIMAD